MANTEQNADTGAKVIHIGQNTRSEIVSKSLSKGGGISTYRGLVDILPTAHGAISRVQCDALMLDSISKSNTIPVMRVRTPDATVAHEASAGRLSEDACFFLQSRGLGEDGAKTLIVNGFLNPIVRELPLEYATEMNILIRMEMEGSIG